jgi:hypothetical protein
VPNTGDDLVLALKSIEEAATGIQATYITLFSLKGDVLMEETLVPKPFKFEGLVSGQGRLSTIIMSFTRRSLFSVLCIACLSPGVRRHELRVPPVPNDWDVASRTRGLPRTNKVPPFWAATGLQPFLGLLFEVQERCCPHLSR